MTLLWLQECYGNTDWCFGRGRVHSWSVVHTAEQQMSKQTHPMSSPVPNVSFFLHPGGV